MNQADINKKYGEVRGKIQEFDAIVAQFEARKPEMEAELQGLTEQLPRLLAGIVLGEVPKTELTKVKKRIREIEEFLGDFKATREGFVPYRARISSEGRKISHLERRVQVYERFKKRFNSKPNAYFEKDLLDMAEGLDCLDEAKKFLKNLKEGQVKS